MHASVFRPHMSEGTFQILLDVMERHFAALRIPDSEPNKSLSRTRSFSELPAARRIVLEQTYKTGNTPNLIRQYSCEEVFDARANVRQVKFSEVVTSGIEEHKNVWTSIIPNFSIQNGLEWSSHKEIKTEDEGRTNHIELMEIDDVSPQKCQTFPSKSLPLAENTLKEPEIPVLLNALHIESKTNVEEDNKSTFTFSDNTLCQVSDKENIKFRKNIILGSQHVKKEYQDLKKKFRPLVQPTSKSNMVIQSCFCNCWKLMFLLLLPVAIIMIAIVVNPQEFGFQSNCKQSMYYARASVDLRKKIYGQEEAVTKLVSLLENTNSCKRIIALIGGTGVGKSYTGEIIAKNFPIENNVFHYYSPLKYKLDIIKLSKSACNLIVLENLKESDVEDAATFSSKIENLKGYCSTILMIFNMQKTDENLKRTINLPRDTEMIKKVFENQNLYVEVIAYEKLNEPTLEYCIKDAAKKCNIVLSRHDISDIMRILQSAESGCKGAYSKVQIIRKANV